MTDPNKVSEAPERERSPDEVFYDQEVAPALKAIGEKCQARGLPFASLVEFGTRFGVTAWRPEEGSASFNMVIAAIGARGNIDGLLLEVIREARKKGHSSAFLAQLGVPPKPMPEDKDGLSPFGRRVLQLIASGKHALGAIARECAIPHSAARKVVAELVRAGMVVETHERREITPKGREVIGG